MAYDDLANYFSTNFALMQHHKWSITELEAMMPWERHVYIDLLRAHVKRQEQEAKDRATAQRGKR